jgi:choline-glycine betaine transporter
MKFKIPLIIIVILLSSGLMIMNGQVYDQSVFWILVSSICATTLIAHIALNRKDTRVIIIDIILVIWSLSIVWTRFHGLSYDAEYQRNFNKRHSELSVNDTKNPDKPAHPTTGSRSD